MNRYRPSLTRFGNRKGMAAVMVALVLMILVGFAAMAVDVGYLMVTRNELQNIADATALYGARWLGDQYEEMTQSEQQSYLCDPAQIVSGVQDLGQDNYAGGMLGITIDAGDIRVGQWDPDATPRFTETLIQPDAVSVTARREGGTNGPISSIFARVLGVNTFDVRADATAALTYQQTAPENDDPVPIGISRKWFERPEYCDQPIKFYPTGTLEGCAGWHTFTTKPASASRLKTIIDGMKPDPPTFQYPPTIAGETQYEFIGGNIANQICNFKDLFDQKKLEEHPYDQWETAVVVYDRDDCSNPNKAITIVGFATAIIHEVTCPPDEKVIQAEVICENVEPGRGGGEDYGTQGSIPGLVE